MEITREFLIQKYCNENLNMKQIAVEAGVPHQTIESLMKKFNVPRTQQKDIQK